MSPECLTRKRIWEVDCLSMDAVIAAAFDWRDLANLLLPAGEPAQSEGEAILEMKLQCLAHQACHSENAVSIRMESLLNGWYADTLQMFADMPVHEVLPFLLTLPDFSRAGALFWAMGTDKRDGFDCIRRRFHQRFQVVSLRAWRSGVLPIAKAG